MQTTQKGLRLHIGIFGRRNVGKSSVLNAITRQAVSIVSDVAGTTTDPVEKAMELLPLGPVLFVDTAGVDDVGALGELRVRKTMGVVDRTDLAIVVTDDWQAYEGELLAMFVKKKTPVVVVANKSDLRPAALVETAARQAGAEIVVSTNAVSGAGIAELRQALIRAAPDDFMNAPPLIGDLVPPGRLVVMVVPIDLEAPKGRLILPQVQTLRDILDNDGYAVVVKERELAHVLSQLKEPPALVVTDSQEFMKVAADTPPGVPLTSFSILFARFKGDLVEMVKGALAIASLKPGDRILIAEACSHHPVGEDIGRTKIPRWLEQFVGGRLDFTTMAGPDFPDDLGGYKLIVHCGSCVANRRQMLHRIERARAAGVPITNYGLTIAYSLGILDRALGPFPYARETYRRMGQKTPTPNSQRPTAGAS